MFCPQCGAEYRVGFGRCAVWETGYGRLGPEFNPIVGPVALQVGRRDAELARSLVAELGAPRARAPEAGDAGGDETDGDGSG